MPRRLLLHFSPHGRSAPPVVARYADQEQLKLVECTSTEDVAAFVSRTYPAALIVDATEPSAEALSLCSSIKGEPFTAVVPVIMYVDGGGVDLAAAALEAGADEVLTSQLSEREHALRVSLAVRRAERDVSVHPTTRLPGTVQIERDFAERLRVGQKFAACYADLDHFKEFNDRYGYNHGDRVILIVSRILRDVVMGLSPHGFVGHIGGDDFIYNVPVADIACCAEEVISVFDELIPFQYSQTDRDRGFFLGKDRRGEEYEVPLMSLSIGIVTNQNRSFTHTAQISELASEMKAYAKTLPGSKYVVDRRIRSRPPFYERRKEG
jgi:GGDEF domain-containing protein